MFRSLADDFRTFSGRINVVLYQVKGDLTVEDPAARHLVEELAEILKMWALSLFAELLSSFP